jgi:hypothetical protein
LYWPDPEPRLLFRNNVLAWRQAKADTAAAEGPGLAILKDGLLLALDQVGLPFGRRTFLEFVCADEECLTWWEALPPLCQAFGVGVSCLTQDEIMKLTRWIFNPSLD